jgi:membrane protein DedA with SNARE-associated domain
MKIGLISTIFLSAFLEYIIPPYPGDTAILAGYFMAGRGDISLTAAILSSFLGSMAGSFMAYYIGYKAGTSYFLLRSRWVARRIERLQKWYERFGGKLLIINRFLPGLRGIFLYTAGMGRLSFMEVAIYSTISNILWLILIGFVGMSLGTNWEDVKKIFEGYTKILGVLFIAVFLIIVVRRLILIRRESRH